MKAIYTLQVEPMVKWLNRQLVNYETVDELAFHLKQETPWLRSILSGKVKTIDIDKADEILCIEGSTHLREIYPDLYGEY